MFNGGNEVYNTQLISSRMNYINFINKFQFIDLNGSGDDRFHIFMGRQNEGH